MFRTLSIQSHWSSQEVGMILVRNVFRVKFGKTKEAVALMKEGWSSN